MKIFVSDNFGKMYYLIDGNVYPFTTKGHNIETNEKEITECYLGGPSEEVLPEEITDFREVTPEELEQLV